MISIINYFLGIFLGIVVMFTCVALLERGINITMTGETNQEITIQFIDLPINAYNNGI